MAKSERKPGEHDEAVIHFYWRPAGGGRPHYLGMALGYYEGWKFHPAIEGHRSGRKYHPTWEQCLPKWVRYPDGCESAYGSSELNRQLYREAMGK